MRLQSRIKFVSKTPVEDLQSLWSALVPATGIADVQFTFDPDDRNYDGLIVYEDLPPLSGERKINRVEVLSCGRDNTLLMTTEPSSIRLDGLHYLSQFGAVWSSRPFSSRERAFLQRKETRLIDDAPPLRWFYGRDFENSEHMSVDAIAAEKAHKSKGLSTVTSTKAMAHTIHAQRIGFISEMKARLGEELDLFGRGIRDIRDKREAMRDYRYHIAIENHLQSGHHTEKLADCFLALCLPFYFGDPNYAHHYPKDAVIPIDINDPDRSERIIRDAIAEDAYSKRLPALQAAKRITLAQRNPLQAVSHLPLQEHSGSLEPATIYGRHAFRKAHPMKAVSDALHSARLRRTPYVSPYQATDSGNRLR